MNWRIEKACALVVDVFDDGKLTSVMVKLTAEALDRVCIGVCLLEERLIDSLDLVDIKGKDIFRLLNSKDNKTVQFQTGKIIVGLDPVQLMYFTLCAVRDGLAEVDHLDFELTHYPQRVDLCVKYPFVGPPLSPEQVRRQLGL